MSRGRDRKGRDLGFLQSRSSPELCGTLEKKKTTRAIKGKNWPVLDEHYTKKRKGGKR